jgi:ribosomal protein S18 acetylase RimI-like enzyme
VRDDELDVVGDLVEAAYTRGGLLDNDRGYGAHVRDVRGRAPHVPVLVAERDGRIVGSVTVVPPGTEWSELARDDEVEFRFLGVAPEAWGTGVARALVDAVDAWAGRAGARGLVLCVIRENTAAAEVYRRLGFDRAPERDWVPMAEVVLQVWQRPLQVAADGSTTAPDAPDRS